jgi:phospho-N-acetylmuramoyl-pentapeptide-transferase
MFPEMLPRLAGIDWDPGPGWRALLAALSAFVLALAAGYPLIGALRRRQLLESVARGDSERLDRLHAHKGTTPTLGGVIVILATVLATLGWARLESDSLVLLLLVFAGFGVVGFLDDSVKLRSRRKGLSARQKFLAQTALAFAAGVYLYAFPPGVRHPEAAGGTAATSLFVPFIEGFSLPLGIAFVPFTALVIVGAANAVNLTDGLDGLAAGTSALAALPFVLHALVAGDAAAAGVLAIPHVAPASEIAVFAAALLGGALGFLWFNCHPAQVFMGDTGSLALGGALGLIAVLLRQELLLVLVGGVLVAEALSVILQVAAFKLWGRRLFRIAPLHHHFEFKGWAEGRITVSFWVAGALLAAGSLAALRVM